MGRLRKRTIITLLILGCLGLFLIGGSATGMFAISQSCCFGPDCPADYLCDAAETPISTDGNMPALWLGVMLVGITSLYLTLHHRTREQAP